MTCYNRKQKTLDCLAALFNQVLPPEVALSVYLVDDGSTDGTSDAVHQTYPQVKISYGDGQLFWNGGMRQAFAEAVKHEHDYHLWLNDDTLLYPETLKNLLETSHRLAEQGYTKTILVGSTCDPQTGEFTYGGLVRSSWWHPLQCTYAYPGEEAKPCDTMNGNCILIRREVFEVVGNLDPAFAHNIADWDYALRAKQKGCTVWVAPGYVGTCARNPQPRGLTGAELSLSEQLKRVSQPKGLALKDANLHPIEEWKVVSQRYGGVLWPIFWLLPYRRLLFNSMVGKLKGEKA